MSERNRINRREKISLERAYQAIDMSGLSRLEIARKMGRLNGGYKDNQDDKGCYKALSKALTPDIYTPEWGYMSGKMLDKFCETVNVDPYVISGDADKDLKKVYESFKGILADYCSFEDYKKSLNLKLYPNKGNFPRINEDYYKPAIYNSNGLIGAYNQLMGYFGVRWIDTQTVDLKTGYEVHTKAYYDLMDNILDAIDKCIDDFNKEPQKVMTCDLKGTNKLIYTFRNELNLEGYFDVDVEED